MLCGFWRNGYEKKVVFMFFGGGRLLIIVIGRIRKSI